MKVCLVIVMWWVRIRRACCEQSAESIDLDAHADRVWRVINSGAPVSLTAGGRGVAQQARADVSRPARTSGGSDSTPVHTNAGSAQSLPGTRALPAEGA